MGPCAHVCVRATTTLPVRCAPAQTLGTTKRSMRNWCRRRPRSSPCLKESDCRPLWRVESRVSAGYAPRRGPTSDETRREGAEAARGRCGGEGAPLGELGDAEQRAGTSSVMRIACGDGSNGARQQCKRLRGRNTRAMRATTPAARCGIAPSARGLRGNIGFIGWRRAWQGIRPSGGEAFRRRRSF